jgi:hypothetical protein
MSGANTSINLYNGLVSQLVSRTELHLLVPGGSNISSDVVLAVMSFRRPLHEHLNGYGEYYFHGGDYP